MRLVDQGKNSALPADCSRIVVTVGYVLIVHIDRCTAPSDDMVMDTEAEDGDGEQGEMRKH